jgi:DNA polymerase-3 subunit beta
MRLTVNRGALLDIINAASGALPTRSPKPVLQCFRLVAERDALTISATDLELYITATTPQVQIEQCNEVLLHGEKLREIVRESPDDTLTIEVSGDSAQITGLDSRYKLFTQPVSDFPPAPPGTDGVTFSLPCDTLRSAVHRTVFAMAAEETKFAVNGALFAAKGRTLDVVATDGRRMAKVSVHLPAKVKEARAIVPRRALAALQKADADEVAVELSERSARFKADGLDIATNVLEGMFPPYEDVIPKDTSCSATMCTDDFLSAVKRAAMMTSVDSAGLRMAWGKAGVTMTSRSPTEGEAEVKYACRYEGEPMEIGFNPDYMVEALRVCGTEEVRFEMTAPSRPGLMKAGDDWCYVLMPVNLK